MFSDSKEGAGTVLLALTLPACHLETVTGWDQGDHLLFRRWPIPNSGQHSEGGGFTEFSAGCRALLLLRPHQHLSCPTQASFTALQCFKPLTPGRNS